MSAFLDEVWEKLVLFARCVTKPSTATASSTELTQLAGKPAVMKMWEDMKTKAAKNIKADAFTTLVVFGPWLEPSVRADISKKRDEVMRAEPKNAETTAKPKAKPEPKKRKIEPESAPTACKMARSFLDLP
eukprot:5850968-Amphidinium_carterae.1